MWRPSLQQIPPSRTSEEGQNCEKGTRGEQSDSLVSLTSQSLSQSYLLICVCYRSLRPAHRPEQLIKQSLPRCIHTDLNLQQAKTHKRESLRHQLPDLVFYLCCFSLCLFSLSLSLCLCLSLCSFRTLCLLSSLTPTMSIRNMTRQFWQMMRTFRSVSD